MKATYGEVGDCSLFRIGFLIVESWSPQSKFMVGTLFLNEDGFCSPPLPVVRDHLFHPGPFPMNVVVTLLHMYHSGYWTCQPRSPHFMYHSYHHLVLQLACAQQVGSSGSSLSHLWIPGHNLCSGLSRLEISSSPVVPSSSHGPRTVSSCWLL